MRRFYTLYIVFLFLGFLPVLVVGQQVWDNLESVQYDGQYFYGVASQQYQILKLDKLGKTVAVLGSKGRGPGEFASPHLDLLLSGESLYALDSRGMSVKIINPHTFEIQDQLFLKKPASGLVSYASQIYSLVNVLDTEASVEAGTITEEFRNIYHLEKNNSALFDFKDPQPINPFYDSKELASNGEAVVILQRGKNIVTIFQGDSLYHRRIPEVEVLALGNEIERNTELFDRPLLKKIWKQKIMPQYYLIRSAYLGDDNILYMQLKSYRLGNKLIAYDLKGDQFKETGTLSQGKLLAVDKDTVYTANDQKISTVSLSKIASCKDQSIRFFFASGAWDSSCTSCRKSVQEWFGYIRDNNIPLEMVLEDNAWFGSSEVDTEVVSKIMEWNLWGKIHYQRADCSDCFSEAFSVGWPTSRGTETPHAFPQPKSVLEKNITCK